MIIYARFCKYYNQKNDMYGNKKCFCTHPSKIKLDNSLWGKVKRFIFGKNNKCNAHPAYEMYCPLYEEKTKLSDKLKQIANAKSKVK
ncbi:hypothetical protein [Megasphaera sueciensis]|uniref:hypothetical protein n=1 Tax=Megasphaera sueciensis TaxID=349094 RepID=UPI003D081B41